MSKSKLPEVKNTNPMPPVRAPRKISTTIANAGEMWDKIAPILGVDPEEYPLFLGKNCGICITLSYEGVHFDYRGFVMEDEKS